jgi:hypothetical protein
MLSAFQQLTVNVFKSATKGTRYFNRKARTESYQIIGSEKYFDFKLPANYAVTVDQQYDFQVFKFHRYQSLLDTNWVSFIIYVGNHPSSVARQYGLAETSATALKGKFLGKKVQWLNYDLRNRGALICEQQIPCDELGKETILHVAMMSNKQSVLDEVRKLAETVKISKKHSK